MDLEEEKWTATPAPRGSFRRLTVSVSAAAMTEDTQRAFEQLIVELIANAVCNRLELKEESHELPRT